MKKMKNEDFGIFILVLKRLKSSFFIFSLWISLKSSFLKWRGFCQHFFTTSFCDASFLFEARCKILLARCSLNQGMLARGGLGLGILRPNLRLLSTWMASLGSWLPIQVVKTPTRATKSLNRRTPLNLNLKNLRGHFLSGGDFDTKFLKQLFERHLFCL